MKKILLSAAFLVATITGVNAQVFQSDNFNSYTVGNLGTDLTGEIAGQGGWLTFTSGEGGANSDFQIVDEGGAFGNVLQITGSSGNENKFAWLDGLATDWDARISGNDILKVKLNFYTGPVTASANQYRVSISGVDSTIANPTSNDVKTIAGFSFNASTKIFQGLAYINGGQGLNTYLLNFATGGLVLPSDTWIDIEIIFNSTTGRVDWYSQAAGIEYLGTDGAASGFFPLEATLINVGGTNNTTSSMFKLDDFMVGAVASEEDPLSTQQLEIVETFSIYPNPAKDVINVANSADAIENVTITDMNGRVVKQVVLGVNEGQINISDLSQGVYILNATSNGKSVTEKIVKQ